MIEEAIVALKEGVQAQEINIEIIEKLDNEGFKEDLDKNKMGIELGKKKLAILEELLAACE